MARKKMPLRSVKIPDEIWEPAQEKAEAEGKTLSAVIREELARYIKRKPKMPPVP